MKKEIIKHYLKAFFLGIFILLLISTLANCVPFGKYFYNSVDSFFMYPQLLVHSIRTLFSGQFFYNLNSFLGSDFYNVRTLYMNSPLNLLLVLFKESNVFVFYTFLIYLRKGLSTVTMCIYLNSISKNKYGWKQLLFSLFYTFSTFGVAYSVHIMWMDSFILLPLIILGLDKLITEDKVKMYIITLTLAIMINFYIGYALCLFCLLYFIYKSYITNNLSFKVIKRFIVSSLLCGLMCSVILIPQIYSLMAGRGSTFSFENLIGINIFTLLTIPVNLITGSFLNYDILSNGSPLIYCTIFALVMNILYYFNKNISVKEKKATSIFTIFFLISLCVKLIDYSWNMFQEPVWFAHRYIFVFIFFLVVISFINFENINGISLNIKKRNIILLGFTLITLVSFTFKAKVMEVSSYYIYSLYFSLILFIVYFIFIKKKYYNYLIIVLVLLEMVFNGYNILCENTRYTSDDINEYFEVGNSIDELKEIDNSFYRTVIPNTGANDAMYYDYYSTVMFSSSYNENTRHFLKEKVDYLAGSINNMYAAFENPAILSLVGVKYIVGESTYYNEISNGIYLNDKVLNVGFVVPNKINEIEFIDNNQYYNINKIYSSLLGEDVNLFEDVNVNDYKLESFVNDSEEEKYKVTYSFVSNIDGVIVPNTNDFYDYFTIKINDDKIYKNKENNVFKEHSDLLLYVKKGDKIEVEINILKRMAFDDTSFNSFGVKILREKEFKSAIEKLQKYSKLENISVDNCVISGNIKSDGGTLFITIPYLDTFEVYVDGKKVEYEKVFDTFIGMNIDEGEHKIIIKYLPKGFVSGVTFSFIGVFLTIIYIYIKRIIKDI